MVTAILLPLLAAAVAGAPPQEATSAAAPQVQVWLSGGDQFVRGDNVRVYVKADADGYMLVLHAEPDGRIHVLFPLDPGDDNYVGAGKTYEVRGRGDREAFTVYGTRGEGAVYAAYSRDPFQFGGFALNGHWDYRAQAFTAGDDPEADLTSLAQQLAGAGQFGYDLARYDVVDQIASGASAYDPYYGYDPYYHPYYYGGWYRPWRSGLYVGLSFGSPWYDCWACNAYYDPWYDPYFYAGAYWPYSYYGSYWYRPSYYGNRYAYYGPGWHHGYGGGWWTGSRGSLAYGRQRYGFYYVQPGRRTLGQYGSSGGVFASARRPDVGGAVGGRVGVGTAAASGRRQAMPPATDGGRVVAGPRRVGGQSDVSPRGAQPRPLEVGPRTAPRREAAPSSDGVIRRVPGPAADGRNGSSPRGLVPLRQGDARATPNRDARAVPSRDVNGPRAVRGLSPVDGSQVQRPSNARPSDARPQLERRQSERPEPRGSYGPSRPQRSGSPGYAPRSSPSQARPQTSRPSAPRVSAPSRSSGPSRSGGASRPSGGGRVSSGGRRRG